MWLRVGSLLFALPGILLLALYGIELSSVTDCTQGGGFYDYVQGVCSSTPQEEISYYRRHSGLVNSMMLLSVVGALAMSWGMLLKGGQPRG
ncbi:hypothetical protein ACQUQU_02365 [Thalassolituus sp. LLYu03]|uniref:hypothetical protein n=1 Tax=Thalassolituus sp. LLYu03 TaxID=3421656 RepID=UPI003D2B2D7F